MVTSDYNSDSSENKTEKLVSIQVKSVNILGWPKCMEMPGLQDYIEERPVHHIVKEKLANNLLLATFPYLETNHHLRILD